MEDIDSIRKEFPLHETKNGVVHIPFNSDLKFTCYLRRVPLSKSNKSHFWLAFKGAPERILDRCSKYLLEGKEFDKDKGFENSFKQANKNFALKGERVLGLAYLKLDPIIYHPDFDFINNTNTVQNDPIVIPNYPITNLCFVGLVAMEDPPRY